VCVAGGRLHRGGCRGRRSGSDEEVVEMSWSWLYLMIAIVAEVVGTSFLRATQGFTRPLPSLAVVLGYGLAFYFLSLTLEDIPAGVAYAVWSGAGVTLIALIGWLFLGQKPDAAAIAGMGLIVAGVVVLNLFSRTSSH
jgi:small multidrug resistance pump